MADNAPARWFAHVTEPHPERVRVPEWWPMKDPPAVAESTFTDPSYQELVNYLSTPKELR